MSQAQNPAGKAIAGFLGAALVALLAAGGAYAYTTRFAYIVNVNGDRVGMAAYQRRMSGLQKQYAQQMGVNFNNEAGKSVMANLQAKVMDRLVESTLIRQEAEKQGVSVTDAVIDKQLADIVQTNFGGDKSKLDARLKQLEMTSEDVREQIADSEYAKGLLPKIGGSDGVSEAEALKFYTENTRMFERDAQVKAAHILVPTLAEANDLRARLQKGADFATLAKEYSKDPGSGAKGGDLGFFKRGQMVKEFEQTAFTMPIGQISAPVKTQFGYHLIKVTDKHSAGVQPFANVKGEIMAQRGKQRQQEAFRLWLDGVKKKAEISYAAGYTPSSDAQTRPDDGHGH